MAFSRVGDNEKGRPRRQARVKPPTCAAGAPAYFSVRMNNHTSIPVGVLGASGYVGQELMRLLHSHPDATVAFATAESAAGEWVDGHELIKADDAPWQQAEIILSALPHGVSAR